MTKTKHKQCSKCLLLTQYMNVSIGGDGKEGGFGKYTFISSLTTTFNCLICWDIWNNQLSGFVHNYGGNAEEAFSVIYRTFLQKSFTDPNTARNHSLSGLSLKNKSFRKNKIALWRRLFFSLQFWVNFSSSIVSAEPIRRRKLSTGEIFGFVLFVSFIVYGVLVWLHFFRLKANRKSKTNVDQNCACWLCRIVFNSCTFIQSFAHILAQALNAHALVAQTFYGARAGQFA